MVGPAGRATQRAARGDEAAEMGGAGGRTGKNCGVHTPKYWQFTVIADDFGIDATALRRLCDKARARGKWARYLKDGTLNPANPAGLTYVWRG